MGMGMKSLKWEGIGTKNLFPHTSNVCVCVCVCVRACMRVYVHFIILIISSSSLG